MSGTPADGAPARISPEFRNGSLTAISVIVGFSLSFLSRCRHARQVAHRRPRRGRADRDRQRRADLVAWATMLFVSSMALANYERAIRIFLVGLGLVAVGVAVALLGEVLGIGQGILGG